MIADSCPCWLRRDCDFGTNSLNLMTVVVVPRTQLNIVADGLQRQWGNCYRVLSIGKATAEKQDRDSNLHGSSG